MTLRICRGETAGRIRRSSPASAVRSSGSAKMQSRNAGPLRPTHSPSQTRTVVLLFLFLRLTGTGTTSAAGRHRRLLWTQEVEIKRRTKRRRRRREGRPCWLEFCTIRSQLLNLPPLARPSLTPPSTRTLATLVKSTSTYGQALLCRLNTEPPQLVQLLLSHEICMMRYIFSRADSL